MNAYKKIFFCLTTLLLIDSTVVSSHATPRHRRKKRINQSINTPNKNSASRKKTRRYIFKIVCYIGASFIGILFIRFLVNNFKSHFKRYLKKKNKELEEIEREQKLEQKAKLSLFKRALIEEIQEIKNVKNAGNAEKILENTQIINYFFQSCKKKIGEENNKELEEEKSAEEITPPITPSGPTTLELAKEFKKMIVNCTKEDAAGANKQEIEKELYDLLENIFPNKVEFLEKITESIILYKKEKVRREE